MNSEWIRRYGFLYGTWALGIIFLLAAGLKAIDIESFSAQIGKYQMVPAGAASGFAVSIIVIEAGLGAICIAGFYARKALWAMILLMITFVAVTLLNWHSLQGTICNCFGQVLPSGPALVLWHNAVLIALAGSLIFITRKTSPRLSSRWLRTTMGVITVLTLMFVVRPSSVRSSLAVDSATEDHIRVFVSSTCKQCQASTGKISKLVAGINEVPVRVFIGAQYEQQIKDFLNDGNLDVQYIPISFNQLAQEVEQVPQIQLYRNGKVVKQWTGEVPSLEEVKEAISLATHLGDE